jgi:hypothetical protein
MYMRVTLEAGSSTWRVVDLFRLQDTEKIMMECAASS